MTGPAPLALPPPPPQPASNQQPSPPAGPSDPRKRVMRGGPGPGGSSGATSPRYGRSSGLRVRFADSPQEMGPPAARSPAATPTGAAAAAAAAGFGVGDDDDDDNPLGLLDDLAYCLDAEDTRALEQFVAGGAAEEEEAYDVTEAGGI